MLLTIPHQQHQHYYNQPTTQTVPTILLMPTTSNYTNQHQPTPPPHQGWGQKEWQPSWQPTVEYMVQARTDAGTPLCFTSFDRSDMLDDVAFLCELDTSITSRETDLVWYNTLNPYRSLHAFPHDNKKPENGNDTDHPRMIQVNNYVSGY